MWQRVRVRLAERIRRIRRFLAIGRRRDPAAWVLVLAGMALGLCLFLLQFALTAIVRLVAYLVRSLR
jgi:hypothetical protein